jgi:ATP-binding cassette subfamily C protein CydCD
MAIGYLPVRSGYSTAREARSKGAFDPRLLHYARTTRVFLVASVGIGGLTTALVVAQAWLLASIVAGAFVDRESFAQLRTPFMLLLAAIAGRAALAWLSERSACRGSARAKSEMRRALAEKLVGLGPAWLDEGRTGQLAVLATRGVDSLDTYFSRYLPQVFLAVIVPVAVIAVVVGLDWISAAIIAVTVPLVPVFMALVGASTRELTERQLGTLQRLGGQFLDAVAGLPTLKIFGRAKAQARAIGEITERYGQTALATLRLAFLSSLILELLATLSVALVAVAIGLRLLGGHLDLRTALFVLVLAPEAYLPLRLLGTNYHASAEGMEAAQQIFGVLDQPLPARGPLTIVPDPSTTALTVMGVQVTYPGRQQPALRATSFRLDPGEVVAIVGPSGCGKSTLLGVLLGIVSPTVGGVRIGDTDLGQLDLDAWRSHLAWVPQRPHLFATSINENIRLGRPDASTPDVAQAVADAGLEEVVARLPRGLETRLGEWGAGLSVGERQRIALARAFVRDAPLLLLDEPTANLDGRTEESVLRAVRRLMHGRTVVIVAHRPALAAMADRVIRLSEVAA